MSANNLEGLRKTIQEQKKIINFFQQKFQEQTGNNLSMPSTWSKFLNIADADAPIQDQMDARTMETQTKGNQEPGQDGNDDSQEEATFNNFIQAFYSLNLPQKMMEPPNKKKNFRIQSSSKGKSGGQSNSRGGGNSRKKDELTTTFDQNNKSHMVEKIELCNYSNKNFSRAAFREFLESIADMRCLKSLVLSNNGIDDSYLEEITMLLQNERIVSIDLSRNNIGRAGGLLIGKLLKESEKSLQWLDLSRNKFHQDPKVIATICAGLKNQKEMFHLSIDTSMKPGYLPEEVQSFRSSEKITMLLLSNPKLRSLSLIDSNITDKAMLNVQKALSHPNRLVTDLSFKFSFLSTKNIYALCRGLELSRSLVKLDLSSNGLPPLSGIYIVKALHDNMYLNHLDLSRNNLNDDFAKQLARCLNVNDVLWKVDISNNPIGEKGALAILKSLKESNETLSSLGDLQSNIAMGILNIQQITTCLRTNDTIKDYSNPEHEEKQLTNVTEINPTLAPPIDLQTRLKIGVQTKPGENSTGYYDGYQILKPLAYLNGRTKRMSDFHLWNI